MKNLSFFLITTVLLSIAFSRSVNAHSGRTNSSGCHNCNVGSCAGTYHCHGGYSAPPPVYVPISTPKPTKTPTPKPTATPLPTSTPTPSPVPEVQAETTEATPTPKVSPTPIVLGESDNGDGLTGLLVISTFGALGGGYWLYRKTKNRQIT